MKIKFRTDTRSFDFDDVRLKIRDIYNLFDKDINIMRLDTLYYSVRNDRRGGYSLRGRAIQIHYNNFNDHFAKIR